MGRFVIVSYTPKEGMEGELLAIVKRHMEVLSEQGLVTDKPAYVMRAADGSIIEIFEWRSVEAIEEAHGNAAVQELWDDFASVCEFKPLTELAECKDMFAEFDAIDL